MSGMLPSSIRDGRRYYRLRVYFEVTQGAAGIRDGAVEGTEASNVVPPGRTA
jgi:hypothetical protein